MKIRLNKLLILLLFPVHLLLLWYMQDMPGQTGFLLLVLLVLAADFVLSFLQTEIFSAKGGGFSGFAARFLPYFLLKLLIAGADGIITHFLHESDFIVIISTGGLWFAVCAAELLLCALVVFVTGWARSMLDHDRK
ncbi:MAG: hypothetical protein J6Z45_00470 [Oscillospiraceae bacterium]|nr:hypothetical protein [Oscillospiraceae bacterium]